MGGGGGGGGKLDKLPEYLRETVDWFMGKTFRRGDKSEVSEITEEKLYLKEKLLRTKVTCILRSHETFISFPVDLPTGLDLNEWLATQSARRFNCGTQNHSN